MNTIINEQKPRAVSPFMLAGLFVSTLVSSATVQAMPGMTEVDVAAVAPQVAATEAPAFAEFEPLYRQHCAACHGDNGDGKSRAQRGLKPPPRDFTTVGAWQELDRIRMIASVTHGRPNTAMVGWQGRLNEMQIAGVVDYVRSSFMRDPVSTQALVPATVASLSLTASGAPSVAVLNSSKRAGDSGRDIYKRNCSACHGDKGNGSTWTQSGLNPPPRDFTADEARQLLNRERMIASVTYGRDGTAMMPFNSRLSAEEIVTVVDYIRGDFMRIPGVAVSSRASGSSNGRVNPHSAAPHVPDHPGRDTAAGALPLTAEQMQAPASHSPSVVPPPPRSAALVKSDMSLQLPHGLVGDVAAGRVFYMDNCFVCHGVRGDGHGPRSSFITPRPRNFLGERARNTLNRPALFRAISLGLPGTVMPAWSKVLSNQEIANVTEFVFQTFIQRDKAVQPSSASTMEPQAAPGKLLVLPQMSPVAALQTVQKSAVINTAQEPASPLTAE
ncbi:MAG: c-type cytochrome [Gammaproteobacteria bacterium]|nr:c-type cytochrome [Gammaproteobacteria bacterium]